MVTRPEMEIQIEEILDQSNEQGEDYNENGD